MRGNARQLELDLKPTGHGGSRPGSGRPKRPGAGASHAARPGLTRHDPVHVTVRVCDEILRLRSERCFELIEHALAGANGPDFRVTAFSVQGSHLHLIAEAGAATALARGMQRLSIRLAKGLNRLMGRTGRVFRDRYFVHVLRTPQEVRAALAYVAGNTVNHAARRGRVAPASYSDPYTFGYFGARIVLPKGDAPIVVPPESWLLQTGWRLGNPSRLDQERRLTEGEPGTAEPA